MIKMRKREIIYMCASIKKVGPTPKCGKICSTSTREKSDYEWVRFQKWTQLMESEDWPQMLVCNKSPDPLFITLHSPNEWVLGQISLGSHCVSC